MTITEIAQKAGVSIGTVDRVVHNRGHVAEETRKKVQAVIDEYDFKPNHIASQLKRGTVFTVGVLLPPLATGYDYWKMLYSGIQKAVESLKPFSVTTVSAFFDRSVPGSLYEAGKKMIAEEKIDALILAPIAPEDATALLAETDIPYVFIDSPLPSASPVSVISQNPYNGGRTAAHVMKLLKDSGIFVVIRMWANAYNLRERSRGFQDYFKDNARFSVIDAICPDETSEGVFSFMDDLFALYPDINGIFVTHTEGFMFAQYLNYTGRKDSVALIGYDLQAENRKALMQGSIDCIISQRPEYQGHTAVYEIYRSVILNQPCSDKIHIPIDILMAENAEEYN